MLLAVAALIIGQLMVRFDGFFVTWCSFTVGLAASAVYLIRTGQSFWPRDPKPVLWRCFYGGVSLVLYYLSVQFAADTRAAMINLIHPFFIVLLAPLFFGEKLNWKIVAGVMICLAGSRVVFGGSGDLSAAGELLGIASAVTAALALLYLKKARSKDHSVLIYFWICAAGFQATVFSLPQAARLDAGSAVLLVITGLLVFSAQVLLNYGIRYLSAATAGLFSFAKIVPTILLGALFGEAVNRNHLAGLGLIILGLLFLGRYGRPAGWFRAKAATLFTPSGHTPPKNRLS